MLSNEEFKALQKQEFDFLKRLKLPGGFFDGYADEVMGFIEEVYKEKYKEEQEIEDVCIFNCITEWEFLDWVRDNYGIKFGEEIRHYFVR